MPRVILRHVSNAAVELYLHGAHITSWTSPRGEDLFFVSKESHFTQGKPIRGGIPLVFPQFGDGPLPKHGFARTRQWTLIETAILPNHAIRVRLQLRESDDTLALWPFPFLLELAVTLADDLAVQFTVHNTGSESFPFRAALHTYFRVSDVRRVGVLGLKDVTLIDSLRNDLREVEPRDIIRLDGEIDRVYVNAPQRLAIVEDIQFGKGRTLLIEKEGIPDAVVWTPWIDKARRMGDFGNEEYLQMLCVETGIADTPRSLAPGASWQGTTRFIPASGDREAWHWVSRRELPTLR